MAVTEYIGSRYVPTFADPSEWNSTRTYEPLTIVQHEGNSYTSKQFVPIGTEITNEDFWAETGNYNAQIEAYRNEVLNIKPTIKVFKTVSDLKNASNLKNGDICITLGYYNNGDCGSAIYLINPTDAINTFSQIRIRNNLTANLVILEKELIPEQFGAYGDGIHDDTDVFTYLFNYSNTTKTPIKLQKKYWLAHTPLVGSGTDSSAFYFNVIGNGIKTPHYTLESNACLYLSEPLVKDAVITGEMRFVSCYGRNANNTSSYNPNNIPNDYDFDIFDNVNLYSFTLANCMTQDFDGILNGTATETCNILNNKFVITRDHIFRNGYVWDSFITNNHIQGFSARLIEANKTAIFKNSYIANTIFSNNFCDYWCYVQSRSTVLTFKSASNQYDILKFFDPDSSTTNLSSINDSFEMSKKVRSLFEVTNSRHFEIIAPKFVNLDNAVDGTYAFYFKNIANTFYYIQFTLISPNWIRNAKFSDIKDFINPDSSVQFGNYNTTVITGCPTLLTADDVNNNTNIRMFPTNMEGWLRDSTTGNIRRFVKGEYQGTIQWLEIETKRNTIS